MLRTRPLLIALALLLPLAGCEQEETLAAEPTLVVDHELLDFGSGSGLGVYIGTTPTASFALTNKGLPTLTISGIEKAGDGAFTFEGPIATTLEANERTFVRVFFRPTEARAYQGTLTIRSDAANAPAQVVELKGTGVAP